MTEQNTGNNIETLAERAKDMLERVRGAAGPDALTPPPLPLSTMRDKRAEADSANSSNTDDATADADVDIDADVEIEDVELPEAEADIEDTAAEVADVELEHAKPELIEIEGVPADDEIVIPEVELAETPSFDVEDVEIDEVVSDADVEIEDLEVEAEVELEIEDSAVEDSAVEGVVSDAEVADVEADAADDVHQEALVDEPIAEDIVDELDVPIIDEDADLESLEDPFIDDIQTDTDSDSDSDASEDPGLLNLFGRKDERGDSTVEADSSPDDSTSYDTDGDIEEAVVVDDVDAEPEVEVEEPATEPIDADMVIAELESLDDTPIDGPIELIDLEDSTEVEGVGYLGDVDVAHSGSMSTEDLIVEPDDETNDRIESVVGLDLDDDHNAAQDVEADLDDSGVVSGSTIVAGSAAAAGAVAASVTDSAREGADIPNDAVRRRGRLSDLGPKAEPTPAPQPKGRFSSRRRPAVDHDLNELFLKPGSPDQAATKRSFPWIVPVGAIAFAVLAIALLFLSWFWAGNGDDGSDTNDNDNAQVVTEDTAPEDTTAVTVASTTATTVAATAAPTTEAVEEDGPQFESAADLIGVGSNTADFAQLGAPLGLQQALEQLKVDENGDPMPFTLLAPSDDAIAKLTEAQLDELAADPNAARDLIFYHFVDQPLTPEFLQESVGGQIMTRSGVPIFVELDGDDYVFNGNTRVEIAGLEAENGSVIVIDSVLTPPTINKLLDIGNIQFKVISAIITDEGKTELQKAVTYFTENPEAEALIAGHTDTDGEAEANRRLSQRRADAVRQFLIDAGIDGARLESQGFGEDEPVLVNGVEDKNLSRRIEFVLK